MNDQNYSVTFAVDATPKQVYDAVNNVREWWSGNISGRTDKLDEVFTYRYEDVHYSKQKITKMVPNKKVVWHVLDGRLNFVKDKTEWTGTDIVFDILKKENGKTELHSTHVGLVPKFECYDACSNAWGSYIRGSLKDLITKGKGFPNPTEVKEEKVDLKKAAVSTIKEAVRYGED